MYTHYKNTVNRFFIGNECQAVTKQFDIVIYLRVSKNLFKMSLGFSALKTGTQSLDESSSNTEQYGIESPLVSGLGATRKHVGFSHPLEAAELNYQKNSERMEMLMLRNTQGLHAPLRLAMELKSAEKIGRLPFLPSSNLMRDVILGQDEDISFEDILNTPEFREQMGQPHAVVEKSLGIL